MLSIAYADPWTMGPSDRPSWHVNAIQFHGIICVSERLLGCGRREWEQDILEMKN